MHEYSRWAQMASELDFFPLISMKEMALAVSRLMRTLDDIHGTVIAPDSERFSRNARLSAPPTLDFAVSGLTSF